jgi:hypothetical protein
MPIACYDPATGELLGVKKILWDIYQEVNALTTTQATNVWTDLNTGTPPKLAVDEGVTSPSIFTMHFLATAVAGLTATEKNEARRRMISFYVWDNPKYLVNPPFDPTIQIQAWINP